MLNSSFLSTLFASGKEINFSNSDFLVSNSLVNCFFVVSINFWSSSLAWVNASVECWIFSIVAVLSTLFSDKVFWTSAMPTWTASSSLIKFSNDVLISLYLLNSSSFLFFILVVKELIASVIFSVLAFISFIGVFESIELSFKTSDSFLLSTLLASLVSSNLFNSSFFSLNVFVSLFLVSIIFCVNSLLAPSRALVAFEIASRVEFSSATLTFNASSALEVPTSFASSFAINSSNCCFTRLNFCNSTALSPFALAIFSFKVDIAFSMSLVFCLICLIVESLSIVVLLYFSSSAFLSTSDVVESKRLFNSCFFELNVSLACCFALSMLLFNFVSSLDIFKIAFLISSIVNFSSTFVFKASFALSMPTSFASSSLTSFFRLSLAFSNSWIFSFFLSWTFLFKDLIASSIVEVFCLISLIESVLEIEVLVKTFNSLSLSTLFASLEPINVFNCSFLVSNSCLAFSWAFEIFSSNAAFASCNALVAFVISSRVEFSSALLSCNAFLASFTPAWIASSFAINSSNCVFILLNSANLAFLSFSWATLLFNFSIASFVFITAFFSKLIGEELFNFSTSANTFLASSSAFADASVDLAINSFNLPFSTVKSLNSASFLALISWSNLDFASSSALVAFVISSRVEFSFALLLLRAFDASSVPTSFASSVLINCSKATLISLNFCNSFFKALASSIFLFKDDIAFLIASVFSLICFIVSLSRI